MLILYFFSVFIHDYSFNDVFIYLFNIELFGSPYCVGRTKPTCVNVDEQDEL